MTTTKALTLTTPDQLGIDLHVCDDHSCLNARSDRSECECQCEGTGHGAALIVAYRPRPGVELADLSDEPAQASREVRAARLATLTDDDAF